MLDIKKIRKDFPFLVKNSDRIYFDNSATSQKPKIVLDSIVEFYENYNANIHRALFKEAIDSTREFDNAREIIAQFFGADSNQLIFTRNTTEGLNLAAYFLEDFVDENSEILTTILEHHSNLLPFQRLAEKKGAKFLVSEDLKSDGTLETEALLEKISEKTKVFTTTLASNVTGENPDFSKVFKKCKSLGVKIVLDCAQFAPHKRINFHALEADFLAFSGHKMLGPTGIGGLFVSHELKSNLNPFLIGGGTIKSVSLEKTEFADFPEKFEAGTPDICGVIALSKAVSYLNYVGMENIKSYEEKLSEYFLERAEELKGMKIFGPKNPKKRSPTFSFVLDGVDIFDLGIFLDEKGIGIRAGYHCAEPLTRKLNEEGVARASLYFYNTKSEIDRFFDALSSILK